MSAVQIAAKVKFHFGLEVADLDRAVKFYRLLFGSAPMKFLAGYAEFELNDPPLVLALKPGSRNGGGGGALNHVGFRVSDSAALVKIQYRLEAGGIPTQREEGVECCYSRQTKFWVPDADRNLWEIYVLEEDIEHSGFGADVRGPLPGHGAELSELRHSASQQCKQQPGDVMRSVVYLGPLAQVADAEGHIYRRGLRVRVPESTCGALRQSGVKDSFAFLK